MAKLLLVEDDINLRDIYSARFMAEQYQVITASDGEEALATAVREKPDLIILDVMMPKISGFDVLDILRSTPETKQTKIIMMTALSQDTDKARGEALGVNKYLIKSQVTLEDVVTAVKEILDAPSDLPSASVITATTYQPTPEPAAVAPLNMDASPINEPVIAGHPELIMPSANASVVAPQPTAEDPFTPSAAPVLMAGEEANMATSKPVVPDITTEAS